MADGGVRAEDLAAVWVAGLLLDMSAAGDAARRGVDRAGMRAALAGAMPYRRDPVLLLADACSVLADAGVEGRVRDWREVQIVLQGMLETVEGVAPPVPFDRPGEDAAWWAGLASTRELEAYLRAIVRELGTGPLPAKAAKRLLVAMWAAISPSDRAAFLKRVDPEGQFRGAA